MHGGWKDTGRDRLSENSKLKKYPVSPLIPLKEEALIK